TRLLLSHFSFGAEPVSHPWFGFDVDRMIRTLFNFLAQILDHHSKIVDLVAVIRSPDGLKNFSMRDGFIDVLRQIAEHIEFFRCEAIARGATRDSASGKIDEEIPEPKFR